jgi:thimet oligopeptidase
MTRRALLLPLLLGLGCSAAPASPLTPPAIATTTPLASASAAAPAPPPALAAFDPLAVPMNVEGLKKVCDDHLAAATTILGELRAKKTAPEADLTFAGVLGRLDDARLELENARMLPILLGLVHPDAAVRAAAALCEGKATRVESSLAGDPDLAAVVRAYAQKHESLEGERARFLTEVTRDLKRGGAELSDEDRAKVAELDAKILKASQEFLANIATDTGRLEIKPAQLAGLPGDYIARHPPKNGKVHISTSYADYFPFATYAKDRRAAHDLYVLFTNRGGEDNLRQLDRLLRARAEKARLLGYPSWAAYALEPRMAKKPEAVRDLIERVRAALKEPLKGRMKELAHENARAGGRSGDKLTSAEIYFLEERIARAQHKLDATEVSKYFEADATVKGVLAAVARTFGLVLTPAPLRAWHADVTAFDVALADASGAAKGPPIGRLLLDVWERPGKGWKHVAMFPVRTPKRLANEDQTPIAAIVAGFDKSGATPSLLEHGDVATLFHELGHAVHFLVARPELASHASTECQKDFVEAPAMALEDFAYDRAVLDGFAKHVTTGATIPEDLFHAMVAARPLGRVVDTAHQLFLAALDLEYHAREPGFDSTQVLSDLQTKIDSSAFVNKTHFQTSFGHLTSYDAAYYGYIWSRMIARDLAARLAKEGGPAAIALRDEVLAKGAADDASELLTRYLGRPSSDAAYFAWLAEDSPAK